MSVTDSGVVDAMTLERANRKLVLRIFDHLPWDDNTVETHKIALQGKINDYLDYLLDEQYQSVYSNDLFDIIEIKIIGKYQYNDEGLRCLRVAKEVTDRYGFILEWELGKTDKNE